MSEAWLDWVCQHTGAAGARRLERVQSLWSGYGEIVRVALDGADAATVIVKRVVPPIDAAHPRGWGGGRSHARKLRSYDVEAAWYRRHAERCPEACPLARPLALRVAPGAWCFVLEDLDARGFSGRRRGGLASAEMSACLRWLAWFHAAFLGEQAEGLWAVGTYWHLETRPDELRAMRDRALRDAAAALDARLSGARFQTLVHGDAKVANFCFAPDGREVAAVDFQYVGGGCGVKDLAYFLGSVLDGEQLEARADGLVDAYFDQLCEALNALQPGADAAAIEAEWRGLYPLAWADFERFLDGWAPGHSKRTGYARRLTQAALSAL